MVERADLPERLLGIIEALTLIVAELVLHRFDDGGRQRRRVEGGSKRIELVRRQTHVRLSRGSNKVLDETITAHRMLLRDSGSAW
jgi:hypothetical protein